MSEIQIAKTLLNDQDIQDYLKFDEEQKKIIKNLNKIDIKLKEKTKYELEEIEVEIEIKDNNLREIIDNDINLFLIFYTKKGNIYKFSKSDIISSIHELGRMKYIMSL